MPRFWHLVTYKQKAQEINEHSAKRRPVESFQ